jgi:uncharacterized protein YuzE
MIQQSYDLDAKALYITMREAGVAQTIEIDSGTLVDVDSAGSLVGIEVINPNRNWPLEAIIKRFALHHSVARELRAYFPQITRSRQSASPERRWPTFDGTIRTVPA